MQRIVRISEIELNGFKNVKHGRIEIDSAGDINKGSLLGIYGQNGSGKTAVVEAMGFIQKLLMGGKLPENTSQYINTEMGYCEIKVVFYVDIESKKGKVLYAIRIRREEDSFEIENEELSYYDWNGEKYESKHTVADSSSTDLLSYKPKYRYDSLVKEKPENRINIAMAKKISLKDKCSFIFSEEGRRLFAPEFYDDNAVNDCVETTSDYDVYIKALYEYAWMDIFVITSKHNGPISMELLMPVTFKVRHKEGIAKGAIPIMLSQPSEIPEREFQIVKQIIDQINIVLSTVIPDMTLEVYNHGKQLVRNGDEGYRIEILSNRGNVKIPLKYESEGIIKIVSILNVFMCIYNNPGMCMVVDELDSGIFEFLFGEMLSVFEEGAKGQLIFTSHNLRALEMIDKKHLIFSTTNDMNRYIHLKGVKSNNNLRDLYLRTIILGGQSEEIYAETDSIEIRRALRKAGRKSLNEAD